MIATNSSAIGVMEKQAVRVTKALDAGQLQFSIQNGPFSHSNQAVDLILVKASRRLRELTNGLEKGEVELHPSKMRLPFPGQGPEFGWRCRTHNPASGPFHHSLKIPDNSLRCLRLLPQSAFLTIGGGQGACPLFPRHYDLHAL